MLGNVINQLNPYLTITLIFLDNLAIQFERKNSYSKTSNHDRNKENSFHHHLSLSFASFLSQTNPSCMFQPELYYLISANYPFKLSLKGIKKFF